MKLAISVKLGLRLLVSGLLFFAVLSSGVVRAASPTLGATPASVAVGAPVTVTWAGVAATTDTWVGVYRPGGANYDANHKGLYLNWFYDNNCTNWLNAHTAGTTKPTSGSCSFPMLSTAPGVSPAIPLMPGTYEFRLFAKDDDLYKLLATSNSVTVTAPSLSVSLTSVGGGGNVTVTWNNVASPKIYDWIGLYHPGEDAATVTGGSQNWMYNYCSKNYPAPVGFIPQTSGSCTFPMIDKAGDPITPGTYEFKLFWNDEYGLLATSGPVTVVPPSLSVTPSDVAVGVNVAVGWSNIANPLPKTWIGLYHTGAANDQYNTWLYLKNCNHTSGTGPKSGSCPSFPMQTRTGAPLTPGTYEFRLFADDDGNYALLATSAPVLVGATKPYFKVYGGDVSTGGGFNNGTDSAACSASFQAPTYTSSIGSPNKGGIMAFVNQSFNAGASTQLGAFSLGVISNNGASGLSKYGFFAGGDGTNLLTFANDSGSPGIGNYYGGVFENARLDTSAAGHKLTHCIPDYYTIKGGSSASVNNDNPVNVDTFGTGKYLVTTGATRKFSNSVGGIPTSKNITIFVNGNVFIDKNLIYAPGYSESNVPKFALVVSGNIYIDFDVTRLDGLYIAQPKTDGTGTGGEIWTCHDNSTAAPGGVWLSANCNNNNLTVNGAFVAKQIQLTRVKGDVATAGSNENPNANMAEIFNYTPEMVLGCGFFNQCSSFGTIQKLVNLPPVF